MPPPRKSRTGLIVGISVGVAVFLILAVAGGAALVFLRSGQSAAPATPTTTAALPSPTPQETVLFQDPLTSDTNNWNTDAPFCHYAGGGYEVSGAICFAPAGILTDANVSVDVQAIKAGSQDTFGIALRRASQGNFYVFEIDSNSNWDFVKVVNNSNVTPIVDTTQNTAIKGGLNVTNTLLLRAKGSHFDFYINGTKVGQADDSTYPSGKIGLSAVQNMQAVFNNIKVTTSS